MTISAELAQCQRRKHPQPLGSAEDPGDRSADPADGLDRVVQSLDGKVVIPVDMATGL